MFDDRTQWTEQSFPSIIIWFWFNFVILILEHYLGNIIKKKINRKKSSQSVSDDNGLLCELSRA